MKTCLICDKSAKSLGLCSTHYMQHIRHGAHSDTVQRAIGGRKFQFELVDNATAAIPLTRGMRTLIDANDVERIAMYNWCALSTGWGFYAARNRTGRSNGTILLHHEILGVDASYLKLHGLEVDHIDRNTLNNKKQNLRKVTRSENALNTERSDNKTSVTFDRSIGHWRASIYIPEQRKRKYLGISKTEGGALEKVRLWKENNT